MNAQYVWSWMDCVAKLDALLIGSFSSRCSPLPFGELRCGGLRADA
jgi:hypothetical protein